MTDKENFGKTGGWIYNHENKANDAPQESSSSEWFVSVLGEPDHVKKQYTTFLPTRHLGQRTTPSPFC